MSSVPCTRSPCFSIVSPINSLGEFATSPLNVQGDSSFPFPLPRIPLPTDHCLLITDHLAASGSVPYLSTCKRMVSHLPCYNLTPMARQRLGQHFLSDLHWRE